ncbi:hypothetical protein ACIGXM_31950 [Kitasatospora sp. NPDC052896]|uniref:hypothetical protein n=1 Tax=Kitasatospora sp. NPDC052896 TaxID=3364061 RepID=UPI0037CB0ABE
MTRQFTVERYNAGIWVALNNAQIDGYVRDPRSLPHATEVQYWEAWIVRSDGGVVHGTDEFTLCSIIPGDSTTAPNSTRGTYSITGDAWYIPATNYTSAPSTSASDTYLRGLGFATLPNHPAGVLLATRNDPNVTSAFRVTHTVTVTWDSTQADRTSRVT